MSKNCKKDKDCTQGQICSGTSNKCIAPDKRAGKVEMKRREDENKKTASPLKPAKPIKLSLKTQPVKVNISPQVKVKISPQVKVKVSKVKVSKVKGTDCLKGMIFREKTGKCVKEDGEIGRMLIKARNLNLTEDEYLTAKKDNTLSCPDGMIFREKTKKCVKVDGKIGKKLLKAQALNVTEDEYDLMPIIKPSNIESVESPELAAKINRKSVTASCISKSKMPLRNVQIKTVEHFNDNDSLLVVHGTGMGKTLTAVTAAECYLKSNPYGKVVVITGLSLINNFKETLDKYGSKNKSRYEIYNYDRFMNKHKSAVLDNEEDDDAGDGEDLCDCRNAMLIIDEVHTLKNYAGKKFIAAMECAQHADKVLLLTATPYMNSVCDFIAIINLLHRKYVIAPLISREKKEPVYNALGTAKVKGCGTSSASIQDKDLKMQVNTIAKFLVNKISFAEKPLGGDYPEVEMHNISIPMNRKYEKSFNEAIEDGESLIFENPAAFYNGYRRAVNKVSEEIGASSVFSDKLKYIDRHIIKKETTGNLIFSNWLNFGVEVIEDFLNKKKISHAIITGETDQHERKKNVDRFNAGKLNTLVISSAGGTGIDLKGVQNIIILDPVWNAAQLDQVIGRGVRYKSHAHLPEDKQKVHVYLLSLVERALFKSNELKLSRSGDVILYNIIESKKKISKYIEDTLKKICVIDNDSSTPQVDTSAIVQVQEKKKRIKLKVKG